MPEVGSVDENHTGTLENPAESDIVGKLFLSSDVVKSGDFNPEDHVILVVPESSEHLVSDGENGTSYVIPTSEDAEVCDGLIDVDTNRLRETIKSNFLVIAKLLPSKSPPPLVPIVSSRLTGEELKIQEYPSDGPVIQKLATNPRPVLPKTPAKTRHPRTPRSPGARNHTVKQEGPEIFGKMFPASYNEVMYKQIREIIYFKCGKDTTEETEVSEGINCPHCRKKPLTLALLKEHLANCHTYSSTKRKNTSSVPKTVIKKTLFRCQYCDEAFISQSQRESHECSLALNPLEHVKDETSVDIITCDICRQDFGSPSELECHQAIDHEEDMTKCAQNTDASDDKTASAPVNSSPKIYIVCQYCDKRVSSSLKEEHLKRHRDQGAEAGQENAPKCVECSQPVDLKSDKICSSCQNGVAEVKHCSQESSAVCPTCDLEIDSASYQEHVFSHRNDAVGDFDVSLSTTDVNQTIAMVRIIICSSCQDEFKVPAGNNTVTDKCKKCQIS